MARWPATLALLAALAAGAITLHACGGSNGDQRDRGVCDACDPNDIDDDCQNACLAFCPDGEDCAPRCRIECDQCRADLACVACVGACVEPRFRCAPAGGTTTCDNGRF